MNRHSWVDVDLEIVKQNVSRLRAWNGRGFFCPMVKANAYGHGDVVVADAIVAAGVDALGVALVEEGVRLRQAGVRAPILVFAPFDRAAASVTVDAGLTPVIGRPEHLAAFRGLACDVHLKVNVGMQRLGFDPSELGDVRAGLGALRVAGVCAHLTHGEEADDPAGPTARELARFRELSEGFPGVRHAHKSASLAALRERVAAGGLGSRPGIGIYGLPHEGRLAGEGLRPALTWRSEIAAIHSLAEGAPVGYGGAWVTKRATTLGVVPIGYGDGYARRFGGRAEVVVGGRRVPVVGRVCMDYMFVDLTDLTEAPRVGDAVVLIGRQGEAAVSAADLAEWAGTISYEVVTAISTRVPRRGV